METIKGRCKTNLDDYNVSLVTEFARCPNTGERVAVLYKGEPNSLKIVQIVHSGQIVHTQIGHSHSKQFVPYIIVELHN